MTGANRIAVILLTAAVLGCCRTIPVARQFDEPCLGQRVCTGRCVQASMAGEPCTPGRDECATPYVPCARGLACAADPGDPQRGTCEPLTTIFCDPSAPPGSPNNRCEDGLFCARYGTLPEVNSGLACIVRPQLNTRQPVLGVCTRAGLEGERCTGSWEQVNQPQSGTPRCNACAPGLICFNSVCRRPCRDGEGGIGNCLPNRTTRDFTTQWSCSPQTGILSGGLGGGTTIPICSLCVPRSEPCDLPPKLAVQLADRFARNVCCDPDDVCRQPLVLTSQRRDEFGRTCCALPTFQNDRGGPCTIDGQCCAIIHPIFGNVGRCCMSVMQRGCRELNRCAGCGPGTRLPCCDISGNGCMPNQTCVTRSLLDDTARCVECGAQDRPCCRRGDETRCDAGLACFRRSGMTETGDRCEPCGLGDSRGGSELGRQCCPGNRCEPGAICVDGRCTFCGERGEICCNGRCAANFRCVDGRCVPICGAEGTPCCGMRGPFGGSCTDLGVTCVQDPFVCLPCGRLNQPICRDSGQPPCQAGLGPDRRSGTCVTPCGGRDEPCCVSASPVTAVTPCGGRGQPCCVSGGPFALTCRPPNCCSSGLCIPPPD